MQQHHGRLVLVLFTACRHTNVAKRQVQQCRPASAVVIGPVTPSWSIRAMEKHHKEAGLMLFTANRHTVLLCR